VTVVDMVVTFLVAGWSGLLTVEDRRKTPGLASGDFLPLPGSTTALRRLGDGSATAGRSRMRPDSHGRRSSGRMAG